jgi:hypothetical protein
MFEIALASPKPSHNSFRKQTKYLLFNLEILWCSNKLMQKMTSITPSIYGIYSEIETIFKVLCNFTLCPVLLELFCPFTSEILASVLRSNATASLSIS